MSDASGRAAIPAINCAAITLLDIAKANKVIYVHLAPSSRSFANSIVALTWIDCFQQFELHRATQGTSYQQVWWVCRVRPGNTTSLRTTNKDKSKHITGVPFIVIVRFCQ